MKKWKKWTPLVLIILSLFLNLSGRICQPFADCYVNLIFPLWAETYGRLMGLFPFSAGEWMLYTGAVLAALFIIGGIAYFPVRLAERRKRRTGYQRFFLKYACFVYWIIGVVSLIMTLNCFLLYQTSVITRRFQIGSGNREEYEVQELAKLRDHVVSQANELSVVFERDEKGRILYQGSMEEEAVEQMQRLGRQFKALAGYYPKPKELCWSGFYSQQYMMGYYFPFSMEANYNGQMYITNMPVTMCHELSHLKGFIREDEANFIGYLACVDSEDPLFRYSAYLSVIGYLDRDFIQAAGKDQAADPEHPAISRQVNDDRIFLTREMWEQVEEQAVFETETVRQAADAFLNTTLTLNGVEDGTVSYSRVAALLLKYYDGILY